MWQGLHTIQFEESTILNIPKREVGSKIDNPTLQIKHLYTSKDNIESLAWSQMLELLTEISVEKRFYNYYIIDYTYIRLLWWGWF